jgi:hypothetical protein
MKEYYLIFVSFILSLFLSTIIIAQESPILRLEVEGEQGEEFKPIIEQRGIASTIDIHVYPSNNWQSEISIAINPVDFTNILIGANVVISGQFEFRQGYYYSFDSGLNWDGDDVLPTGPYTSDPAVVFDADGNAYFNYIEQVAGIWYCRVKKSTDGGIIWGVARTIPTSYSIDKNHMTSDITNNTQTKNNLYVAFTDFGDTELNPIKFSRSINGSASYSIPQDISSPENGLFAQGVNLAVGPNGELFAVWAINDDWFGRACLGEYNFSSDGIGFNQSIDGGENWLTPVRIFDIDGSRDWWCDKCPSMLGITRMNDFPVMAVDRSNGIWNGNIYIVWGAKGTGGDRADLHFSKSTDGGLSWSTPILVNSDGTTNDQWLPWITVNPNGLINIVFYDSRNDPNNVLTEVWVAQSRDGGMSFTNFRVSDVAFEPCNINGTSPGYMGDYIGITSDAGVAYASWMDNRTARYQVYLDRIDNTVCGTISSNTTWSGYKLVTCNVTVNSGVTLTIEPGTFVFFESGTGLTINGTLNAQGLSSNRIIFNRSRGTSTWGSIIFDGPAASSSIIDNADIMYASDIQCLNDANVTIQNSIIDTCTQGIYIYNSQPQVLNNQIIEPTNNGIYGEASGKRPLIQGNVITKSTSNPQYKQFQGIIFGNSTRPFITHNDISGFYHAVYLGGGTYTLFTDDHYVTSDPNNRLRDSRYGLNTGWGSTTIAAGDFGAANSIYNNSTFDVYSYQYSTVYATHNYWGGGEPNKYVDGTSYLSTDPYLTSDPWAGSSAPISNQGDIKDLDNFIPGSGSGLISGPNSDILDLLAGMMLERDRRINEAVIHYKQMVNRNVFFRPVLTALASIANEYNRSDLLNYFEELLNNRTELKAILLKLLAVMHLHRGNYDETLNLYDEIIMEYGEGYEGISARLDKFFAVINYGKNLSMATNLLLEIESLNITDEELLIRKEFANYLLNGTANLNKGTESENNSINDDGLPREFVLFDNYPNPFNPTTTIKYSLPKAGVVSLKVYDILGIEVATLVNENKPAGSYEVDFDAGQFPSGVYFYKLQTESYIDTKKMILLK